MNDGETEKPIALDAYEELAELFAALVDTKPHNAFYDRPATLSLLPAVEGRRVLDAGCGPGAYAEWLVLHGAEVVAFDASEKMVRFARERLAGRARVLHADFSRPLDFLEDASFDIVLSALALDYVKDWRRVFAEFHRVLRAPGHLVFSIEHPFDSYRRHKEAESYLKTELVRYDWRGFGGVPVSVPAYRRPFSEVVNPLIETGFRVERLLEPLPTEEFKKAEPVEYEKLCREPAFLCVRAAKLEEVN